MGNLYRSVSQITRDKFERTMPQAYCCWAYNFSGKEYHVYAKFIMAGQPGKCGSSLYAADVPTNTPLAPQQVFRYNNHSDPGTLDPQKVENTAAQIVLDLFEGLVWMDGEGQVQPAQAERWEIMDGGRRYIFHLRSGLQWSDGQPLTAEDFVLGWQRAVDPKTASPFAGYLAQAHINNAAAIVAGKADVTSLGVKATDDRTLEVTLEQPVPWFTTMLAWPTLFPVPHHVIAKHGDSWSKPENMVYNGASPISR